MSVDPRFVPTDFVEGAAPSRLALFWEPDCPETWPGEGRVPARRLRWWRGIGGVAFINSPGRAIWFDRMGKASGEARLEDEEGGRLRAGAGNLRRFRGDSTQKGGVAEADRACLARDVHVGNPPR